MDVYNNGDTGNKERGRWPSFLSQAVYISTIALLDIELHPV